MFENLNEFLFDFVNEFLANILFELIYFFCI
nr:MAG TPA: hypothetical protein [Caudoviricetes sp.]